MSARVSVQEFAIRENYIVDTCWGGRVNTDFANTIAELEELRDDTCDNAVTLADRLLFDANDLPEPEKSLCFSAIECVQTSTNDILGGLVNEGFIDQSSIDEALEGGSVDDIYTSDGEVAFELCFGKNETQIQTTLDECEAAVSAAGACDPPEFTWTKTPECGADLSQGMLPECPAELAPYYQDFGPDYPDADALFGYATATAVIRATGWIPCPKDRTVADASGIVMLLKNIFQIIQITLEQLRDMFPKDLPYVAFAIIAGIPPILVQAMDIMLDSAGMHDGLITGAEIEASYENTKQLLAGSAAIYDEVVCRCVDDVPRRKCWSTILVAVECLCCEHLSQPCLLFIR